MRRMAWIIAVAACVARLGSAQETLPAASQPLALDNAGGSARAMAMGSAYVAAADDDSALYWNPAGLARVRRASVGIHHNSWLVDSFQEGASAAFPMSSKAAMGLSESFINFGAFQGRDASGNPTTGFSAYRLNLGAGWGRKLPAGFLGGVGIRGSFQGLADVFYSALAVDVGGIWELGRLSLGTAYRNLGSPVAGDLTAHGLNVGAAWKQREGRSVLLLAAGAQVEPAGVQRLQLGAELSWAEAVAFRAGYQLNFEEDRLDGLNSLTLGGGFGVAAWRLDYAYLPFGVLGASHRVSLQYRFAEAPAPVAPAAPLVVQPPRLGVAEAGGVSSTAEGLAFEFSPSDLQGRSLDLEFDFSDDPLAQRFRAAVVSLKKTVSMDERNVMAWWDLGYLFYLAGQKDYAVASFEQVLKLRPDNKTLGAWLERYRVERPRPSGIVQ